MASATKIVETRRKIRKAAAGKRRKNFERLHGATKPALPLNVPNANEKTQLKTKPASGKAPLRAKPASEKSKKAKPAGEKAQPKAKPAR
jgi:hypothetical protein